MKDLPPPSRASDEPVETTLSTKFNLEKLENCDIYTTHKPMPYVVTTDKEELEDKCELCLDLKCCPEHCCDVSQTTILASCIDDSQCIRE